MKGNDLNMYETKVKIDGMMCGMCESHINDAIRNAFSVKKVSVPIPQPDVVAVLLAAPRRGQHRPHR